MAIQFSYPSLSNLSADDLLLVSDVSSQGKPTKNITIQQIVDLFPNIVPGGGTVTSIGFNTGPLGLTVSSSAAGGANPITDSGTFTLGGVLSQGYGGTGFTTSSYGPGQILYTDNSNSLTLLTRGNTGQVLQLSGVTGSQLPSWQDAATGTVTSVQLTVATGMGLTWTATSGANPINSANPAGVLEIGGTLAVANGGTGATTADGALTNLLPSQGTNNGKYLTTNGTTTSWADVTAGVTTIDFSTTGLTPNTASSGAITVGGVLSKTNGGTGVASYSDGDILYGASTGTALNKLSMTASDTGKVLTVNASGNGVQWSVPTSGVGGSGTAGYSARWTGTSTLAASGALRDDGTNVAINALPGVGNTEFIVASLTASTATTGISYYAYQNLPTIGVKSVVGDYYTGSADIIAVQGIASGATSTGNRYGVYGIATIPSAGTNIGVYGRAINSGSGNGYAARFSDGNEAIGKVWVCQTAQGDGAWATSPGGGLYAVDVPTQTGTFGTINLLKDGVLSTSVQIHPNDTTLNNSDLQVVSNQGGTDRIAVAHKDLFTGTAGSYIGVKDLTISSSGHITAAVSEKFVGSVIKGIDPGLAAFQSESALQQLAIPMPVNGVGKPGDLKVTIVNNGTNSNVIKCAFYTGNIGEALGGSNRLVTWGTASIGIGTNVGIAIPVDSNYQSSPQDKFSEGNYMMILEIPSTMQLLSISQDGDLTNGGCFVTGTIFGAGPTYTPAQDLTGITKTNRVAGSPIKLPTFEWVSA